MRLLTILNEITPGSHVDIHIGLKQLKDDNLIDDYLVFSWKNLLNQGYSSNEIFLEILKDVNKFEPTSILWAHTHGLKLSDNQIDKICSYPSLQSMGYYEGDIYENPYKPIPFEVLKLASRCDIVFSVGFGWMTEKLKRVGCKDIRFVPSHTDPWRFGKMSNFGIEKKYDVVMIANKNPSRLFWRIFPGIKERVEIAEFLYDKIGDRFAMFGSGWKGPYAAGPIPFDNQIDIYHQSKITVGVNNLHAKYYFSNRLPIAMSCGIPVIYGYELGFEDLFPPEQGIFTFKTLDECWKIVSFLLEQELPILNKIGKKAHKYSLDHLSIINVLKYMCKSLDSCVTENAKKNIVVPKLNPWVNS